MGRVGEVETLNPEWNRDRRVGSELPVLVAVVDAISGDGAE